MLFHVIYIILMSLFNPARMRSVAPGKPCATAKVPVGSNASVDHIANAVSETANALLHRHGNDAEVQVELPSTVSNAQSTVLAIVNAVDNGLTATESFDVPGGVAIIVTTPSDQT